MLPPTTEYSNLNIWARLGAIIEGAAHATLSEYGKDWCQSAYYGEGEAKRTPLLTHPPKSDMPSLRQSDGTGYERSRKGAMEGSATWTTLLTQLQAPKIPTLSQGYDKATTQIMEGGGGEEDGTPLLTNPPDS